MAGVNLIEKVCTHLVHFDKGASASEIRDALEGPDPLAKQAAMKKVIMMLLNGEQLPQLFITIVRYVLPSEDHSVQKLLLLYLELLDKTDAKGKLLPEMILICQNLRNNLQHPNEYIRGSTLRFLCRIREAELIEPLVPSILANLEHRHSYVRRNAVLAIDSVYRLPTGEVLMPDAPETIERFLANEVDLSARRNAFLMLCNGAQDRAVAYLLANADKVSNWGDVLQMAALELIRKVCRKSPQDRGRYIKIILTLITASSTAVVYECAGALVSLSSAPTAVRAAATCYCQLLTAVSDNNVKLIVLDRLQELRAAHREVMQDLVMDILRALAAPNLDIRAKTLDIALDLITPRNIDEVVLTLKKEVVKTQSSGVEKAAEYRQMLVQAIHACAVKFPDVAGSVVHLLMDFLGDSSTASALDVVYFVREIVETNPGLRAAVLARLLDTLYQVRASRVAACALWIVGEYALAPAEIMAALEALKACLGPPPFFTPPTEEDSGEATSAVEKDVKPGTGAGLPAAPSKRPAVLADGTYATQSAAVEVATAAVAAAAGTGGGAGGVSGVPNLRGMLLGGDFFLGGVLSTTLTKLVLRLRSSPGGEHDAASNVAAAEVMLYCVAMLRLGESSSVVHTMDDDSADRIQLCLRTVARPGDAAVQAVWLRDCRDAFASMIGEKVAADGADKLSKEKALAAQPDALIDFGHLKGKRGIAPEEDSEAAGGAAELLRATGATVQGGAASHQLSRVLQLTGFSDPVYAEAYVTVHQYDIVLDVTVVNRCEETLQSLCLELATMGDLKLVERPQNYTLAPGASKHIRANIKVSSTETGVIFGNIVYESTSRDLDKCVIVLNDIHIDIMDYIAPASCADVAFRNMWAEFEWENKVAVNTAIGDVADFLDHILASTNMRCLTPRSQLNGECGFLAANLYAKSVFGEDALVNVSVEKQPADGKLAGFIRIRSKTQGIALSLGDKITRQQKGRQA